MQKTWSWIKDNAGAIMAIAAILGGFAGIIQFGIVNPMHQRFDAQDKYMNARFDAVDQRLQRLEDDVSELRDLSERVSRNEGLIDLIRQQLQTVDAPSP